MVIRETASTNDEGVPIVKYHARVWIDRKWNLGPKRPQTVLARMESTEAVPRARPASGKSLDTPRMLYWVQAWENDLFSASPSSFFPSQTERSDSGGSYYVAAATNKKSKGLR